MKIYTGCFDNLERYLEQGLTPVNINIECPVYFEGINWLCFAPDLCSFIKFRNKEINEFEFCEEFFKKLNSLNKSEIKNLIESIENPILLTTEPMGVYSSRHQVADWLESNMGVVCEEYQVECSERKGENI